MIKALRDPRTRQWLQSAILLFLGLYFLDNMLSGRIYLYINERFGWLTWLGTGILLALAVVSIADLMRKKQPAPDTHDHDHDHHDHEGHDHDHHGDEDEHAHAGHVHGQAASWPILGVIALPLVLGLVVEAKPLGASAVGSSGISTQYKTSGNSTQYASLAPADRNVLDWIRDFNSTDNLDQFNGQQADVIGFVYRDIRFNDIASKFVVARFTISCCVADATAIGLIVQSPDGAKLAQDSWVRVKGKFQVQDFDGQRTPILVADTVEPTAQPDHPYLYP